MKVAVVKRGVGRLAFGLRNGVEEAQRKRVCQSADIPALILSVM